MLSTISFGQTELIGGVYYVENVNDEIIPVDLDKYEPQKAIILANDGVYLIKGPRSNYESDIVSDKIERGTEVTILYFNSETSNYYAYIECNGKRGWLNCNKDFTINNWNIRYNFYSRCINNS